MARDAKYDILFEPIQIGPKVLKNRFYQVPHCSGFGTFKPHSQASLRAMKAEGGWGAVNTEVVLINPESLHPQTVCCHLWDDDDVRALSLMTSAAHEHGALAGAELHHGGTWSYGESRRPPVGPSAIPPEAGWQLLIPKEMQLSDIVELQRDWVECAKRAREAGFDIVYVEGAFGFLPMQFLSPYYNKRSDHYGGSLENRARFWLETLDAVRGAVGADCAIAVRISVDAITDATVDIEECLQFIRMADHLVDLWDVNVGSIATWNHDSGSSRFFAEGHELEWTSRAREATAKPIVGVSRLTSPDMMVEIVKSGVWDIIGAARPSIADPFLPRKIEEGRLDEIRECIGANHCIYRANALGHLGCMQNATSGEEFRRGWHPERFEPAANADRDVLVVGAGPAGMECAIVLGKRGMNRVHLVDAADELGGAMRWVRRLPMLGEWGRIVNYRQIQIDKLRNVEFVPSTRLDAKGIAEYGGEIVVIATGSTWSPSGLSWANRDGIAGADAATAHVLTPEQVMLEGKRPTGRRVVVYDCDGYFTGAGIAQTLAAESYAVELVSPHAVIGPRFDQTLEGELMRERLQRDGIATRTLTRINAIEEGVLHALRLDQPLRLEVDAIVLVTQRVADDGLYLELEGDPELLRSNGVEAIYRVGDCVTPMDLADTIFDGHRLAREIDSPNPTIPLPYRREAWPDFASVLPVTELRA